MVTAAGTVEQSTRTVHVLWISTGWNCTDDTNRHTTIASLHSEDVILEMLPDLPPVIMHWPRITPPDGHQDLSADPGDRQHRPFLQWLNKADQGELDPFLLVVEGAIPQASLTNARQRLDETEMTAVRTFITISDWIDLLSQKALAVLAVGTCAVAGDTHLAAGHTSRAISIREYLGWRWSSTAGIPLICIPGCPIQVAPLSQTILYLLYQITGQVPMIALDQHLRPPWVQAKDSFTDVRDFPQSSAVFSTLCLCSQRALQGSWHRSCST